MVFFGWFLCSRPPPPHETVVLSKGLACSVSAEEFIICKGCREGSPRSFLAFHTDWLALAKNEIIFIHFRTVCFAKLCEMNSRNILLQINLEEILRVFQITALMGNILCVIDSFLFFFFVF